MESFLGSGPKFRPVKVIFQRAKCVIAFESVAKLGIPWFFLAEG
jgi:hypothetical protein